MDEIFGVSMTTITTVLVVLLAIALLFVALVAIRTPVVFKLGVRNIPRRKAQTVLIVIGLMLSTLIVASALGLGDSFAYSLTTNSYDTAGRVDGVAIVTTDYDTDNYLDFGAMRPEQAAEAAAALRADDRVDGVLPFLRVEVPAINDATQLGEPVIRIVGLDTASLTGFEDDLKTESGDVIDLAAVPAGQIVINDKLAEELDVQQGGTVTVYYAEQPIPLTVAAVAPSTFLTGQADVISTVEAGGVMSLSMLRALIGDDEALTGIAVSTDGDVRNDLDIAQEVADALEPTLTDQGIGLLLFKKVNVDISVLVANVFTSLFLVLGLFSIGVGILLIVLIFTMLAAERRPEMGMARAIGQRRRQLIQQFVSEGTSYALLAGGLGVALGIVATFIIAAVVNNLLGEFFPVRAKVSARSLVAAFSLGVVITFFSVVASSIKISRMNVVAAVRDIPEVSNPKRRIRTLVWAAILILAGLGLVFIGLDTEQLAPYGIGMTIWPFGLALVLRFFGVPSRPVFSLVGLWVLFFWLLPDSQFSRIFGEFDGNFELFFVSGICLVIGATILIVQNTDVLLGAVSLFGGLFKNKLPAIRLAVAYPSQARGRTGMAIAMFSLVIFSLVMIATLNANFSKIFINDDATAGWDIQVDTSASNPIDDLTATLDQQGVDTTQLAAVGRQRSPADNAFGDTPMRRVDESSFGAEILWGMDPAYIDGTTLYFQSHALGYETDAAIIDALKNEPGVAIVNSVDNNDSILDIDEEDGFAPITVEVQNPETQETVQVRVIGIIDPKMSSLYGLYTNEATLAETFPDLPGTVWNITIADGVDAERLTDQIESALLRYGAQTFAIREALEEQQSFFTGFFYLVQGFMGLGLIVGVAAIGVISFRSVVERRQQIGILRALGFQKNLVSLSFMIESAFIVGVGAISGLVLGLALAYNLLNSDDVFSGESFVIPWPLVLSIFFGTIAAALLMTWIPSRQAASIAPAEALRYE